MSYCYTFFVLLIISCHASANIIPRRVARQAESDCRTPNDTPGRCVTIKQCPLILELLKIVQALDKENYAFLKQSSCGKPGEQPPKVCCNIDEITNDAQTPIVKVLTSDDDPIIPPAPKDYSVCGKSNRQAIKIIGGQNATLGAWPWIVALGYRQGNNPTIMWKCGASLISDRWVLTAGHCVEGIGSLRLTTARMGELHLDESVDDGASPVDIEIEKIIPHPQFILNPITNDIALLRLKSPVTFTQNIRPVCLLSSELHKSDKFYAGKSPFIAGWGDMEFKSNNGSKMLQETIVDIVDREKCTQSYKHTRIPIDIRSLCASRLGKDACQGDSGGPLIMPSGASYHLAGIVSFGIGCANPSYPGVYTRVAYYSDWVKTVTGIKT